MTDQLDTQRLAGFILNRVDALEEQLRSVVANPSAAARAQALVTELRTAAEESVDPMRQNALEARVAALEARKKPGPKPRVAEAS